MTITTQVPQQQAAQNIEEIIATLDDNVRLLRLPEVKKKVGFGRTAIYERISKGTFPRPLTLGPKCVAWVEQDINRWIARMILEAQQKQA